MAFRRVGLWAVLVHTMLSLAAIAQDVTLTSRDGLVEIGGTLLGYDGEFYRVDTIYGDLTLDGSGVLCSGPGCPDLNAYVAEIRFSGSAAIGNQLMPAMLKAFAVQQDYTVSRQGENPTIVYVLEDLASGRIAARFIVQATSSDRGFAELLAEDSEIAMSLREMSDLEVQNGIAAGLGTFLSTKQNRVIALDALVPVVSARNPVLQISPEELARVFAGDIQNWNELGGIDAPVVLHLRKRGSGVLQVFLDRIIDPSGRKLATDITRHETNEMLVAAVAADPFAIGLSTLSAQRDVRPLILAGACGFRADASPETLKSDDYPLTAPMFLYLGERRLPAIGREFLRFIGSPAAQIAVLEAGFVDQAISRTPIRRQGDRLANAILAAGDGTKLEELQRMVSAMDGARRLSVTFRFDDGSSDLTAHSRSNIALLARALETGSIAEKELIFVGFSDGGGGAGANRRLSRVRAASVRDAVLAEAVSADQQRVKLRVDGFGEAMPMACDDSEWGRQINRRVEVWAR